MPQRTREHELDDETELAFRSSLPPAWVFRATDRHDYGIDGVVEVFEDGRPTGVIFNVQLKGTDAPDTGAGTAVTIKVDTAAYWGLMPIPTLVIRFHSQSHQLYVRWWHLHPVNPLPEKRTFTFRFEEHHKWSDAAPTTLVEEVRAFHRLRSARVALPLRIYAKCATSVVHGLPAQVVTMALRSAAERVLRLVEVSVDPPPPGAATIVFSNQETAIDLGGPRVVLNHDEPYGDQEMVELIGFDSLLGIGLALGTIGLSSEAASITNLALRSSNLARRPQYLASAARLFVAAHRITEGARLALVLLHAGIAPSVVGAMAAELDRSPRTLSYEEDAAMLDLVTQLAAKIGSVDPRLAAHYWLVAAQHQQRSSPQEAISFIRRAHALKPELDQQATWWLLLAGAAHDAFDAATSIAAYSTVIELGANGEVVARLADSLLAAGRFDESSQRFEQYAQIGSVDPKWEASRTLAARFAKRGFTSWIHALSEFDAEQSLDPDSDLPRHIEYALWWFNRGVRYQADQANEPALCCFLAAVTLFPGDDESWFQATVCALFESPVLGARIILSGYSRCGYAFIDEFIKRSARLPVDLREHLGDVRVDKPITWGSLKEMAAGRELYRVYVDETGDRGSGARASPFFGLAAVVIRSSRLPELRQAKGTVNTRLAREPHQELHWSKTLKKHDQRFVAAEELARLNLRIVYMVVDKSTSPQGSGLGTSRDSLYNYALRLLIERVSWLVDDAHGTAAVTLASVSGLPRRVPLTYLNSKLRNRQTEIRWQALRQAIEVRQAASRDGLQMADIAAGALDRAIRPSTHPPHRIESAYLRMLLPRVYTPGPGRVGSYGLKALPAGLWSRYDWWAEANALPKNG